MNTILVVTNSSDVHVDPVFSIISKLRDCKLYRINTDRNGLDSKLLLTTDSRSIRFLDRELDLNHINTIWYRKPQYFKPLKSKRDVSTQLIITENTRAMENLYSLLPEECFWVSHPDFIRKADSKFLQLMTAKKLGLHTPPTLLTNDYEEALKFFNDHDKNCVYKSLVGGVFLGNYSGFVHTCGLNSQNAHLLKRISNSPVILQPNIPKRFELRITVIGSQVFAAKLDSQKYKKTSLDWRKDTDKVPHSAYQLPKQIEKKIVAFVSFFKLNFSTMDFIVTPDDKYVFLENNPNGQFLWIEDKIPEFKMAQAMADLLMYHKN